MGRHWKRFESEVVSRERKATQKKSDRILDDIESVVNPRTVDDLDTSAVGLLTTHYFAMGLAPATIAGYLRYVRRAILWAHDRSMLLEMPRITFSKNSKEAGGRPLTTEEYGTGAIRLPTLERRHSGLVGIPARRAVVVWASIW